MGACYKCGAPFADPTEKLAQDAVCERCSSWLHCCANCLHYDEYSQKKCREPRAPYVHDRLGRNECAFFKVRRPMKDEPHKKKLSPQAEEKERARSARDELERLFRK